MRALLVVGAVTAALATTATAAGASDPWDEAHKAAATSSFTGQVRIRWYDDAGGEHEQLLNVRGSRGLVQVTGRTPLAVPVSARVVPPGRQTKYSLVKGDGPAIAGDATWAVDVRESGRLRERLFVSRATGLVVAREQYDDAGGLRRLLAFERLRWDPPAVKQSAAAGVVRPAGRRVTPADIPAAYPAPARLSEGYRLAAVYRQGPVVHLVYSDGVYNLSVFEQPGHLDRRRLPAGGQVVPAGTFQLQRYSWAGGEVLMWDSARMTYTAVGDGPATEVVQAAASVPRSRTPSILDRLRTASHTVVELVR